MNLSGESRSRGNMEFVNAKILGIVRAPAPRKFLGIVRAPALPKYIKVEDEQVMYIWRFWELKFNLLVSKTMASCSYE